jgi:Skp family chaperone for outer membrane proteins
MRALAAAALVALAPAALAQDPPAPDPAPMSSTVLVLRQEALFETSAFGKAARARLEAASEALLAENRQIEAQLEAEERDLTARREGMEAAAFRELADAFDSKVEGIRSAQDAKSRALTAALDQDRQTFFAAAVPVLAQIMRERGAVVILDQKVVVVNLDAVDVTAEAVARIDAAIGAAVPPAP